MFYERLSSFYDRVFPLNQAAVRFVESRIPEGGSIADAACGTGTLSLALAKQGYRCIASDLEPTMIDQAVAKDKDDLVRFFVDDMLNVHKWGRFDGVLCLGNSLSHLPNISTIERFLGNAREGLASGGQLILQVVNYDRITSLDPAGTDLPILGDDEVTFNRRYIPQDSDVVLFRSWLQIGAETIENEISLRAVYHRQLEELALALGYSVEFFGDYHGSPFDPSSSVSLICCAKAVDPKS